ncbi:MAG: agmatinase [Bdellovibrionaceae bacterium]|nr:agmatinase [Pseudobdellovibrionaceae bacterium]
MSQNKYAPLSGREFPRYSAIKTFFRLPYVAKDEDYEIGLFGVPFDGGVSYRPGARFAPSHIRQTSSLGRGYHWTRGIQVFNQKKVADIGDCSTVPISIDQTYEKIESYTSELVNLNKKFIAVGGDHSMTLPILRALKKKHQKPLSFIHFDAHLDTYPAAWGCEYHHGSFARHAVEEGLVNPKRMIQIGIRGPLADGSDLDFVNRHGITVKTIDDVRDKSLNDFVKELPEFLKEEPTYLSFDIDCLDPAYAPGTGTPVPGGLTSYEVQKILRNLKIGNLVGGDIVEVLPSSDQSDITSLMAVDVMFEILCLL